MKKLAYYFVVVFFFAIVFISGYYISYLRLINESSKDGEAGKTTELAVNEDNTDNQHIDAGEPDETAFVSAVDRVIIKPSTKFILETVDKQKETVLRQESFPTSDFVGLNRQQVIDYLSLYMENFPFIEYEKGLCGYELVSFSSQEFVIRKTYDESKNPYKFFLTLEDNYVIIYYSDLKTIYDYTSINGNSISYEEKLRLLKGYYVKDSEELFSILEGYTS